MTVTILKQDTYSQKKKVKCPSRKGLILWVQTVHRLVLSMRIFACLASTIDGKIGPAHMEEFVSITSKHDLQHLMTLRDEADGILFGASTYRTWPKVHRGLKKQVPAHHFIMSRSLDLDFSTPLFQGEKTQVTIFTQHQDFKKLDIPERVTLVSVPNSGSTIQAVTSHISKLGINSLLVEGGGQILHQFIEAHLLEELFLTLAPGLIGDPKAPALVGGKRLTAPLQMSVRSTTLVGDEVYLHLDLDYKNDSR